MSISRRTLILSAASMSALTVGSRISFAQQKTDTPAAATAAPASGMAMYDGSPVPPLSTEAIMNPDGIQDRPIGGKNAKVIMVEYASPTCPHCAAFAVDVLPELTTKYIDTGKITFTIRPFIRNVLDAVVFMLAESSPGMTYYNIIDTYFKTQQTWALSDKPRDAMLAVAQQLGFTKESFDAALTNQALFDGMDKARKQALDKFGLTGTPTFYINGKMLSGEQTVAAISAEIDPLLG